MGERSAGRAREGGRLKIRVITPEDIPAALDLWKRAGIHITLSDDPESLMRTFERNPETSLAGDLDGRLAATALGTWDGRRGYLWHLAVDPELQGRGLGRLMLEALEKAFARLGVPKVTYQIEQSNREVTGFYLRMGYHLREDLLCVSKLIEEKA